MNKFENLYENYGSMFSSQKRVQKDIEETKALNDAQFLEDHETFAMSLGSATEELLNNLKDLINTDFQDQNTKLKAFIIAKRYINKILKDERL